MRFVMCALCGFPSSGGKIIPLTWVDIPGVSDRPPHRIRMVVAEDFVSNESLVCEDCVRQIKRLPLTEITEHRGVQS